jgi:hypothetical protein
MPILITKSKSVPNQPSKVLMGFCCPLSTRMITEGTFLRIIGKTILLGNVPPIIVSLGEDNGDHLTSFQSHLHCVFVRKFCGSNHRARINYKYIQN